MAAKIRDVTAVVLAGGRSSRMGFDKALVEIDGKPLIRLTVDRLLELFERVVVASGKPGRFADLPVPQVPDLLPGTSSLVGLHAGLMGVVPARMFAVACDAPFVCAELINHLVDLSHGADWVVPRMGVGVEPLFAVYSQACVPVMAGLVARGENRIRLIADSVVTRYVDEAELRQYDPELGSFVNLNTVQDLDRLIPQWKHPAVS